MLLLGACSPSDRVSQASIDALTVGLAHESVNGSIDNICCGDTKALFAHQTSEIYAGLGSRHVWLQLPKKLQENLLVVSHAVDVAELYEFNNQTRQWKMSVTGDSVARSGSALNVPEMAFALSVNHPVDLHRYMRIVQPTRLTVRLQLWDNAAFEQVLNSRLVFRALLLGFVLSIVLYNLTLTVISRDSVFALNAITVACLIGVDLYFTGYGALYLWQPEWSNVLLNSFLALVVVTAAEFIRRFIQPAHDESKNFASAKLNRLRWTGYSAIIIWLSGLILPYWLVQTLLLINVLVFMLVAVFLMINLVRHGNERAVPMLIPLVCVMLPGGVLVYLRRSGLLPEFVNGAHILEITLALEALVFSLVLGSRLRMLAREADQAKINMTNAALAAARNFSALQDRQRAAIASDLHDSIGHDLIMIKAYLDQSGSDGESIQQAQLLATETLSAVRRLSHELHPALVELVGWYRAVQELFASLKTGFGIDVVFTGLQDEPDISMAVKSHLYRVLQEITSNIAKHSQATRCEIRISVDNGHLIVQVSDNGSGGTGDSPGSRGIGLISIEQRMLTVGGEWKITSGDDEGTTVWLSVPIGSSSGEH